MKQTISLMLLFCTAIYANAQCNQNTKQLVDSLKASIPYPKYNIGDTLYIAFIDEETDTEKFKDEDCSVYKVRLTDMVLQNGFIAPSYEYVLSVGNAKYDKPQWEYQYVDASIKKPKIGELSKNTYREYRFATTRQGAIDALRK